MIVLFCVPGLVFLVRGQRRLGAVLMGLWLVALTECLIGVGLSNASLFFALASMIHSISAITVLRDVWTERQNEENKARPVIFGILLVTLLYYGVFQNQVLDRLVVALRVGHQLVLINPRTKPDSLGLGDWVAYRVSARGNSLGFGQILGLPGDKVQFSPGAVAVNGLRYERVSPQMPKAGEWTVPYDRFLVWQGRYGWVFGVVLVDRPDVMGRPHKSWFGRTQEFTGLTRIHP